MNGPSVFARAASVLAALLLVALILPTSTDQSAFSGAPEISPEVASTAVSPDSRPIAPTPIVAAPIAQAPAVRDQAHAPERPGMAGMVVGIDPETGELGMPTREQRLELEQLSVVEGSRLSHDAAGLVQEYRADGSVHMDLQGRFQEYATVRIGPDGSLHFGCVDDPATFARDTKNAPLAKPALEER